VTVLPSPPVTARFAPAAGADELAGAGESEEESLCGESLCFTALILMTVKYTITKTTAATITTTPRDKKTQNLRLRPFCVGSESGYRDVSKGLVSSDGRRVVLSVGVPEGALAAAKDI
jgi:hypothetical protein